MWDVPMCTSPRPWSEMWAGRVYKGQVFKRRVTPQSDSSSGAAYCPRPASIPDGSSHLFTTSRSPLHLPPPNRCLGKYHVTWACLLKPSVFGLNLLFVISAAIVLFDVLPLQLSGNFPSSRALSLVPQTCCFHKKALNQPRPSPAFSDDFSLFLHRMSAALLRGPPCFLA